MVRRVPHPGSGFTQGLLAGGGDAGGLDAGGGDAGGGDTVWESTGLYGESSLRRYRFGSAVVGAAPAEGYARVPDEFFGEGICRVGDSVWQLTWRERKALRWDAATLELRDVVGYNRDGWGMCAVSAGTGGSLAVSEVVTSDGTGELVRRDPETLSPREVVLVRCAGNRVLGLNDLAWSPWSAGTVWANVAGTTSLLGIDLETGEVTDLVDAAAAAERWRGDPQAIMNGIAALPAEGEFLLTGKTWRWIRRVRLVPARHPGRRYDPGRLLAGASR